MFDVFKLTSKNVKDFNIFKDLFDTVLLSFLALTISLLIQESDSNFIVVRDVKQDGL